MSSHYDTTQPRISVRSPLTADCCDREFELGQAEAMGEAMFFLTLGYSVHVARWDGQKFASECNYLPEDL